MTRYVTSGELAKYLSVSVPSAVEIGKAAGAKVDLSTRIVRYDIRAIDRYIAALRCAEQDGVADILELSV